MSTAATSRRRRLLLLAGLALASSASGAHAAPPVVAVFDIDDQGAALGRDLLTRLADLVSSELVRSGAYRVVPRDDLKRRLTNQKAESYKDCYSESCQIEIGKELAAQYALSTQVVRIGAQCVVTMKLFELRTGTGVVLTRGRMVQSTPETSDVRSLDRGGRWSEVQPSPASLPEGLSLS